ncbi:MAG: hypothetical protein ACRDHZ_05845 [Ktedonobacteraceae bacterium]
MRKHFLVLFEQHKDDRGHSASQPSNHLLPANQPPGPLIDMAFAGNQALIDLFPVRIPLNRPLHDQIHGLPHSTYSSWSEATPIQR